MTEYTLNLGRNKRREPQTVVVNETSIRTVRDEVIETGLLFARIGKTDERLVRFLTREQARRMVENDDLEGLQKLVGEIVFDGLGSLFDNANMFSRPLAVTAYDENGVGVEVEIPKVNISYFE